MRNTVIAATLAATFASQAALAQEASEHTLTGNISFVSDYAFRGVSQTDENPALQGGFDYSHASGLYLGIWGSNISWLDGDASLELDIYGGYKLPLGPVTLDVGLLQYVYPGGQVEGTDDDADTLEGYVGLSWQWFTFKYSYAFDDLFGTPESDGSEYLDLSASLPLGAGFALTGHVGRQNIHNNAGSYTDWKIGVTKEYSGFTFGLAYVDTNFEDNNPDADADIYDERLIVSVSKTF